MTTEPGRDTVEKRTSRLASAVPLVSPQGVIRLGDPAMPRPLGPVGCFLLAVLVAAVMWWGLATGIGWAAGHVIQVFGL